MAFVFNHGAWGPLEAPLFFGLGSAPGAMAALHVVTSAWLVLSTPLSLIIAQWLPFLHRAYLNPASSLDSAIQNGCRSDARYAAQGQPNPRIGASWRQRFANSEFLDLPSSARPHPLWQETRSLSPPGPAEVQVAVRSTGLCGSDLHYYRHYRNGDIIVREPMSLGHESAGVVMAVGSDVEKSQKLKVGDKVALEVGQPCEQCDRCKEGRYNICKEMKFRSSAKAFPHAQGTLQDRINHPAAWCHKSVCALLSKMTVDV